MFDLIKSVALTRGSQLLSRYLGVLFLWFAAKVDAAAGLTPAQAENAGGTVAYLIIAGVLFAVDLLIHRQREKSTPTVAAVNSAGFIKFPLIVFALALLPGCFGTTQQAQNVAGYAEMSAIMYDRNRDKIDEGFLADYRANAQARADALAADAIKAEIGIDGRGNAKNLQLILEKKAAHYASIERVVVEMRKKIIDSKKDFANWMEYNAAMKQYLAQNVSSAEMLNQTSEQVVGALEHFISGKKSAPQAP